jgi:hypothetical protein
MKKLILILVVLLIVNAGSNSQSFSTKLYLYGGRNSEVYLGCINCERTDTNSIWKSNGRYGNPFSGLSIWSERDPYGGFEIGYSPFDPTAKYPPMIKDKDGKSYGYLTANYRIENRAESSIARKIINLKREAYNEIFWIGGQNSVKPNPSRIHIE